MSQHCDTSHFKAEVIFSLPSGGKEGRVISFDPPVFVQFGDFLQPIVVLYKQEIDEGVVYNSFHKISDTVNYTFVGRYEPFGNILLYHLVKRNIYDENANDEVIFTKLGDEQYSLINVEAKSNYFVISDTERTLYHAQYPNNQKPNYEVVCYGCPMGEVPISSNGGEDFICIDKNRVIGEISNLRSKTISIMKYLGL